MISFDDVFVLYRSAQRDVAALRGLTLAIAAQERVLVHGPSGSGKTTLIRVVTGIQAPSAGRAVVCGVDIQAAGPGRLAELRRRQLGLVDQRSGRSLRPEISCVDNIALQSRLLGCPAGAAADAAHRLLERLGLDHLAYRRPQTLSGGEAQRVAVCAALAHQPRLIVADEPTGELDATSADAVYDLLLSLAADASATLLVVSHDPRAARIADRALRIRDGRLSGERRPSNDAREALVIDARGWVRLPDNARRDARLVTRAYAAYDGEGLVLRGTDAVIEAPVAALPDAPPPKPATTVLARLSAASRKHNSTPVLDTVSVSVYQGWFLAVTGRSGSGKSTLLRVMAGLDRPTSGEAFIGSTALADLDRTGLARLRATQLAFVTQTAATPDSVSLVEAATATALLRGSSAPRLAELVDALGLAGLTQRPLAFLSGGERQRAVILRALASETPLVFLDEPTSQLDEANAERLAAIMLSEARRGRAIVCATHDPVLIAHADETLALDTATPAPHAAPG